MNQARGDVSHAPAGSRELLHRVATSSQFQKSNRLRELLLYLGERSLQDPHSILHEQEIGVEVFGRQRDYDTSHDTLVRVQVSQLRKKLQEYFATEGREEQLIVEIPKGGYTPVFLPRTEAPPETEEAPPKPRSAPLTRTLLAGIAIGLVLVALAWGFITGTKPVGGGHPAVDALFRQLFANGQATYLVLSDVSLMEFEIQIGRSVPLSEYEAREFDRLAGLYIPDPAKRTLAKEFVDRVTTSVSDVQVARNFSVLAAEQHLPLNLISARDMTSSLVASQNVILLGSWRANPWVGLFENQMTFRTDYHESPSSVRFINTSPLPGENPAYQAEWRRYGYCRVAFLANPKQSGNVLLISGSDVISSEAGGRFVTSEESMRELRQKIGLKAGDPMPHFEILLRTQVVNSTVPWFEMVAYRPHRS